MAESALPSPSCFLEHESPSQQEAVSGSAGGSRRWREAPGAELLSFDGEQHSRFRGSDSAPACPTPWYSSWPPIPTAPRNKLLAEIQQFRAINPNYTLLEYQLGTSNSPAKYIINGQWNSDWTYVNSQESWFAHQTYSSEPQSASDLTSGRVGNSTGLTRRTSPTPRGSNTR